MSIAIVPPDIVELRNEAFRLAEALIRAATRGGAASGAMDAAMRMQSVANQLGQVERILVESPRRAGLR